MSDQRPDYLHGFLVPLLLTTDHLWTAETSATEQNPQPGDAVPDNPDVELVLRTTGAIAQGQQTRVRIQRAGIPGEGVEADCIWREEATADDGWRGHDAYALSAWEAVIWTDTTAPSGPVAAIDPDTVTLPDGRMVAVHEFRRNLVIGGTRYQVRIQVRGLDGVWSTPVTLYSVLSGTSFEPIANLCPTITLHPNGRELRVGHLHYATAATRAQVQIHRAYLTDLTAGGWSLVSKGALRRALLTGVPANESHYLPQRMRLRSNGGQWLLTMSLLNESQVAPWLAVHGQWASTDGLRFQPIEFGVPDGAFKFGTHDVTVKDGVFVVVYQSETDRIRARRLNAAVEPLSTVTAIDAVTVANTATLTPDSKAFDQQAVAICLDDTGYLWVTHAETAGPAAMRLLFSSDGGETWTATFTSTARWFSSHNQGFRPTNPSLVAHRSRLVCLHNWRIDLQPADPQDQGNIVGVAQSYENSLCAAYIGGWSQVTLPERYLITDFFGALDEQTTYLDTWLPVILPHEMDEWDLIDGGGGASATLNQGVMRLVATATNELSWERNSSRRPGNTPEQGFFVSFTIQPVSGGLDVSFDMAVQIQTGDVRGGYRSSLRFSANTAAGTYTVVITDGGAFAHRLDFTDFSAPVQFIFAIRSGEARYWYRQLPVSGLTGEDRRWTEGFATPITLDTGAAAQFNTIVWGHTNSVDMTSDWFEFKVGRCFEEALSQTEFVNPGSLRGRMISPQGGRTYLTGGLFLYGNAGPAAEGDEALITQRADHPIKSAFAGVEVNPLIGWRSEKVASGPVPEQRIAAALNASNPGGEAEPDHSDLFGMVVLGTNARQFVLEERVGSAWTAVEAIDTAYSYTGVSRRGRILTPDAAATAADDQHWGLDELAGWYVDLGSNVIRKVAGNGSGRFISWSGKRCTIELEGIDGTEPTAGIALKLYPPAFVYLLSRGGAEASGWRLRLLEQHTAEQDLRLGAWWPGPVIVPGRRHSWGRQVETVSNTSRRVREDRVSRRVRRGAPTRTLRFSWTDGLYAGDLEGDGASPGWLTASDASGALPVASQRDVAYLLEGLLRMLDGPLRPVCYATFPRLTGTSLLLRRRRQFLAGELVSAIQLDQVQGDEFSDEVWRVPPLRIEEAPY
ncbi:MAG: hypothetical protein AAFV53_03005 [Myxococcota bacterium]